MFPSHDPGTGAYMRPFNAQSDGQAHRLFYDLCLDEQSEIAKHPKDYSLHNIGIWDDNKGTLTGQTPECVTTGLECIAQARNPNKEQLQEETLTSDS